MTKKSDDDKRMTPGERVLRSRMAAHLMHAKYDARETTAAARKAFLDRFERQVDPEGKLDPVERAKRAEHARKAYFSGLALKRAKKRRTGG